MADFPRINVTVDTLIFKGSGDRTEVLLIKRKHDPFADKWAIPGGFVDQNEPLKDAAIRELKEETGLSVSHLEQLHTFGDPGRDPRGRTVSIVYWGLIGDEITEVKGADDAAEAKWWNVNDLPGLAFDHHEIMQMALSKL